jgi:hypothetical protein
MTRRYSATAHVKQTTSGTGQVIRTESGAAVQGSAGEQAQTVT